MAISSPLKRDLPEPLWGYIQLSLNAKAVLHVQAQLLHSLPSLKRVKTWQVKVPSNLLRLDHKEFWSLEYMVLRGPCKPQLLCDSVVLWTQKQILVPVFAALWEMAIQNNPFSILLNITFLKRQLGQMQVQEYCPSVTCWYSWNTFLLQSWKTTAFQSFPVRSTLTYSWRRENRLLAF